MSVNMSRQFVLTGNEGRLQNSATGPGATPAWRGAMGIAIG